MDEYLQESSLQSEFNKNRVSFDKLNSLTSKLDEPESGFDCNICLDLMRDPVVTFCGHLYCWPCIYRWIRLETDGPDPQTPKCPVCKTEVSQKTLIPLYGRGQSTTTSKDELSGLGTLVPNRPPSPSCRDNVLSQNTTTNHLPPHRPNYGEPYYRGNYSTYLADPMIGMFGEMVYSRIFGDSETTLYTYPNRYRLSGSNSSRQRRRMVETDRSLSRVCFFLCCCVLMCLLLF